MSEILRRSELDDLLDHIINSTEDWKDDVDRLLAHDAALRAALAAAERERDEARENAERLMSLVQDWYEGRARIGAHMTFVDQRFYDSVRLQRTGWPGDDADGDGGPPEE